MAANTDANRVSLADASARGLPELVRGAEEGREYTIVRDDKPVAVVISAERYERLQQLEDDLTDITLVASRILTTSGENVTLDDALQQFGISREELADAPESVPDEVQPASPVEGGGVFRRVDPKSHPLLGRWRIVDMDMWDRDYLDMEEPAYITFNERGGGEFVFGLVYGGLSCGYSPTSIDFTWEGNDEMDAALGDGWAELQDDGTVAGEIRFHAGDESGFKARRW